MTGWDGGFLQWVCHVLCTKNKERHEIFQLLASWKQHVDPSKVARCVDLGVCVMDDEVLLCGGRIQTNMSWLHKHCKCLSLPHLYIIWSLLLWNMDIHVLFWPLAYQSCASSSFYLICFVKKVKNILYFVFFALEIKSWSFTVQMNWMLSSIHVKHVFSLLNHTHSTDLPLKIISFF